jgi:hypothetical protein
MKFYTAGHGARDKEGSLEMVSGRGIYGSFGYLRKILVKQDKVC